MRYRLCAASVLLNMSNNKAKIASTNNCGSDAYSLIINDHNQLVQGYIFQLNLILIRWSSCNI